MFEKTQIVNLTTASPKTRWYIGYKCIAIDLLQDTCNESTLQHTFTRDIQNYNFCKGTLSQSNDIANLCTVVTNLVSNKANIPLNIPKNIELCLRRSFMGYSPFSLVRGYFL